MVSLCPPCPHVPLTVSTTSPDGVPVPPVSPCPADGVRRPCPQLAQKYDPQREQELRAWIEGTTGRRIGDSFMDGLKDGVILCEYDPRPLTGTLTPTLALAQGPGCPLGAWPTPDPWTPARVWGHPPGTQPNLHLGP